jgi:methyl-accepting chemotaxis protein
MQAGQLESRTTVSPSPSSSLSARIPRQEGPATIGRAAATRPSSPRRAGDVLRNLKVRSKIMLSLALLAVVGIMVGIVGIVSLGTVSDSATTIYRANLGSLTALSTVREETRATRLDVVNHALSLDSTMMTKYDSAIADDDRRLDAAVADYRRLSPASDATTDDFVATWQKYRQIRDNEMLPASRANDIKRFSQIRDTETTPLTKAAADVLDKLSAIEGREAADQAAAGLRSYHHARTLILIVLVSGIGLALALGLYFAQLIVTSLVKVRGAVAGLAAGDLTVRADVAGTDELGQTAADLDKATASLRELMETIGNASTTVAASAEELSVVNAQIAASSDQTASQSNVMSAATSQVSSNVNAVADGAREMNAAIGEIAQNSQEAAGVAHEAVTVVRDTATAIGRLGESSAQIESVVRLITTIANQTNLLALNASIEAARAGEAGKGFAVVANEVKDLAQATTTATADISARVNAIQSDSEGAIRAIEQIGEVIDKVNRYATIIASAVEEQNAVTAGISSSAQEASVGTNEIAANVSGVATAAEATRTGVAGSQQASAELSKMASELQSLVGRFAV